jgi:glucans biosynthesis protein
MAVSGTTGCSSFTVVIQHYQPQSFALKREFLSLFNSSANGSFIRPRPYLGKGGGRIILNILKSVFSRTRQIQDSRWRQAPGVSRRLKWFWLAVVMTMIWLRQTQAAPVFSFEQIEAMARESARRPYQDTESKVPEFLLNLSYDQWRDIRFRPEKSLWRTDNLPFEVQFFHPGLFYNRMVKINVVDSKGVKSVDFSSDLFNYGSNNLTAKIPPDLGFAGFRIHYPIKQKKYKDEVAVFLGASFFRAIGRDQVYGLSARGLAIDTAVDAGEEFPYFKEFWLEKPGSQAKQAVVYALLESKSLTGAYKFVIRPGKKTDVDVTAKIFRRRNVAKLGIAPLTSMFFYGENTNQRPDDDFRPEVHDSDGLMIEDRSGEVIWRPLVNLKRLFINSFLSNSIAGFGLIQRDVDFSAYQDQEARYDLRPSVWVRPLGNWGPGHVELVQIPSNTEKNDNIVAFWVPADLPHENTPIDIAYRMSWFSWHSSPKSLGCVTATRSAPGKDKESRRLIIDFKGGKLDALPGLLPNHSPLEAEVSIKGGQLLEKQIYKIEPTGNWRLVLMVKPDSGGKLASVLPDTEGHPPMEVRAFLKQKKTVLTETWSYAVQPKGVLNAK